MIDKDPEIEISRLSGAVSRHGTTVHIEIYRLVEGDESWTSTVLEDRFATDKEAYAEFYRTSKPMASGRF